jgi:hypothetical protein
VLVVAADGRSHIVREVRHNGPWVT